MHHAGFDCTDFLIKSSLTTYAIVPTSVYKQLLLSVIYVASLTDLKLVMSTPTG